MRLRFLRRPADCCCDDDDGTDNVGRRGRADRLVAGVKRTRIRGWSVGGPLQVQDPMGHPWSCPAR